MIVNAIPQQNFEICIAQIVQILTIEIDRQAALFYDTDFEGVPVYLERARAIDKTEMVMVTVGIAAGTYSNQHAGYADGLYQCNVDIWANSKANSESHGDTLSSLKRNRVAGAVRYILEDPIYKTLGFTPGGVGNVKVKGFEAGTIKKGELDADNTSVIRITLEFKAGEATKLIVAPDLEEAFTTLKLNRTDFGFKYEFIEP